MNKYLVFILNRPQTQIIRFACTGILLNILWYLVYLGLSRQLALPPMIAITVCYPFALAIGYWSHFRFTFRKQRTSFRISSPIRYVESTAILFCLNLGILHIFHDRLSYRHEYVQASAVVACAGLSFIILKRYVYK